MLLSDATPQDLEDQARQYLSELINEDITGDFQTALKDGTILCKAMNVITPEKPIKVSPSKLAFKQMENISTFLARAGELGVPSYESFQTVDLYEAKNMKQVRLIHKGCSLYFQCCAMGREEGIHKGTTGASFN
jgi:Calponin homology (CH) domain